LLDKDDESKSYLKVVSRGGTFKDSTLNASNHSYRALERYESNEGSEIMKSKFYRDSLMRSDGDKSLNIHQRIMQKIREQEMENQSEEENRESRMITLLKT